MRQEQAQNFDGLGYWGNDAQNSAQLDAAIAKIGWSSGQNIFQATDLRVFGVVPPENPADFASFCYQDGKLTLAHDTFGARRVFYIQQGGTLWFGTELCYLLALPYLKKRVLDFAGLHTYLAFSYAAAPHTLVKGLQVVPPNMTAIFDNPNATPDCKTVMLPVVERPENRNLDDWLSLLQNEFDGAMQRSMSNVSGEIAVHLSGGLDSSAVAAWLVQRGGCRVTAFYLDFGAPYNAEHPYAEEVAKFLNVPLKCVQVAPDKKTAKADLRRIVGKMAEPWGDPVTLPLERGYVAVREAGFSHVFNGEGGDQLFAGWANRPMLAAEIYGDAGYAGQNGRIESYLQTFHHFYGFENTLYSPMLLDATRGVNLGSFIEPYLEEKDLPALLDRLRWTNYWHKGSQNIMPRAAALSRRSGLTMHAPFFDAQLAAFALNIPGDLIMRGTQEKWLLKQLLAREKLLPESVLERPKRGMGVPATEWCTSGLRDEVKRALDKLGRRGLFRKDYLKMLLKGDDAPTEIRRHRRLGEKIWQLLILELWLEAIFD
jgi:asparagine synthase (glutamine-hydrolysing)